MLNGSRSQSSSAQCLLCAFHEATSNAQRSVVQEEVGPAVDRLAEALIHQRRLMDEAAYQHKQRERALQEKIAEKQNALNDARDEIRDLTTQLSAMTEILTRLQPALAKANLYRKSLRDAREALDRIRSEACVADPILRILEEALPQ